MELRSDFFNQNILSQIWQEASLYPGDLEFGLALSNSKFLFNAALN